MQTLSPKSNPQIPSLAQIHPILPPTYRLPFVTLTGILTTTGMQVLQQIYAAIQGQGGLSQTVNNTTINVTEIQTNITELTMQVTSLQTEISTLQGQVTTLQSEISTLESDITTLGGDVTTLQGQVTALQLELTTLTTETFALGGPNGKPGPNKAIEYAVAIELVTH